jgi:hypothetical protein
MSYEIAVRKTISGLTCSLAGLAMLVAVPAVADAKNNKHVEEVIVGGLVGLAVGAALSRKHQHNNQIYYRGYEPPYRPDAYDPYFARTFSPNSNVICYTAQRVCYNNNGSVANKWSRRVFGY